MGKQREVNLVHFVKINAKKRAKAREKEGDLGNFLKKGVLDF